LEFGVLVSVEGGKLENPEKNPWSCARTINKLNPCIYGTGPESIPGALTTAPSLLPIREIEIVLTLSHTRGWKSSPERFFAILKTGFAL